MAENTNAAPALCGPTEIGKWYMAIAEKIVALWNASLPGGVPTPEAWLRNDGMKAMPADERKAWIEAGQPEIAEDYTIPLYRTAGVAIPPKDQP